MNESKIHTLMLNKMLSFKIQSTVALSLIFWWAYGEHTITKREIFTEETFTQFLNLGFFFIKINGLDLQKIVVVVVASVKTKKEISNTSMQRLNGY